ncbi:50S ribosomal protein L1, partial [Candidatus Saccharibacteria bacterium]|nr:50S ribosomal protein L1 [Candidatus Saccharibacteria bacterium]
MAEEEVFAKSGKKSKKHLEEVKAEEERQARKEETKKAAKESAEKPKGAAPITRPRIERRGKKYQESAKLIEKGKIYNLKDAVTLAIKS